MTSDTAVYDAMCFDIRTVDYLWNGKVGTPNAIKRDGFLVGGELRYCPHEWIDESGYVDLELARKNPYPKAA
jgi:hypothetical protein